MTASSFFIIPIVSERKGTSCFIWELDSRKSLSGAEVLIRIFQCLFFLRGAVRHNSCLCCWAWNCRGNAFRCDAWSRLSRIVGEGRQLSQQSCIRGCLLRSNYPGFFEFVATKTGPCVDESLCAVSALSKSVMDRAGWVTPPQKLPWRYSYPPPNLTNWASGGSRYFKPSSAW